MPPSLTVTPYHRRNLQGVRDLIFHSNKVHTHLDWHDIEGWIESPEATLRLAWDKGRLVGLMGISIPLNQACWLRLAAIHEFYYDPELILCALWDHFTQELVQQRVEIVAILAVQDWITRYAPVLGFHYGEDIVTLARAGYTIPGPRPNQPTIRTGELRDLTTLAEIDQTAFAPPWQLSLDDIRQAYRICSSCTVAVNDNTILGYQLSTLYFEGAHLARLAVAPNAQGAGIGAALLGDLLQRFFRRGVTAITVNTQSSNHRSRSLYTRFGFQPNGYDLPYWWTHL